MYGLLYYDEFQSKWLIAYINEYNYLVRINIEDTIPYISNFGRNILEHIVAILECDEYYELEFHDGNWYILDSPIILYPYMVQQLQLNKEFKIKLEEEM